MSRDRDEWAICSGPSAVSGAIAPCDHMAPGDELHVTYNAMQSGWENHPPRPGRMLRGPQPGWTELQFEYSAFVVLRSHAEWHESADATDGGEDAGE